LRLDLFARLYKRDEGDLDRIPGFGLDIRRLVRCLLGHQ
jgi:hypothetical protein